MEFRSVEYIYLTMVLSELKLDSEHVPSILSWHFLWTAVWHSTHRIEYYQKMPTTESHSRLTQALITLLPESPQKLLAVHAERWLSEEFREELVSIHLVRTLMLDGAATSIDAVRSCIGVRVIRWIVVEVGDGAQDTWETIIVSMGIWVVRRMVGGRWIGAVWIVSAIVAHRGCRSGCGWNVPVVWSVMVAILPVLTALKKRRKKMSISIPNVSRL